MPTGLKRYQNLDHDHHITISCHSRWPYLSTATARDLFERSLEQTRRNYGFEILAYVVMPEQVHLLLSEPHSDVLYQRPCRPSRSRSASNPHNGLWQIRYHDFNVFTQPKRREKIHYIHRNPVTRGLVTEPEHWPQSSYLTYLHRTQRNVQVAL